MIWMMFNKLDQCFVVRRMGIIGGQDSSRMPVWHMSTKINMIEIKIHNNVVFFDHSTNNYLEIIYNKNAFSSILRIRTELVEIDPYEYYTRFYCGTGICHTMMAL